LWIPLVNISGVASKMVSAALLWSSCANSIRAQVPDAVWQSTFNPATAVSLMEDVLEIAVPNTIIKDRLEGEYCEILSNALAESNATHVTLKISAEQSTNGENAHMPVSTSPVAIPELPNTTPINKSINALHPNYVFDKFVTGPSNRFALAAAMSVAETPGKSYNPLFIHGHAGLGKTHLLQAIGHYVRNHYVDDQRHPINRVVYVSTETFLNKFVDAIRTNTRSEFKKNYREVDVLLVDDIQFLEGKEGLQDEFFHTFNSIHEVSKQIVLTSDRPPDAIPTLEDRMTSRFKMGLLTDIQPPDLETRLAILRKKAEQSNFTINDDVLTFIASNIKDNIRELEGALTRVTAYASFNDKPLDLELAQFILRDITARREQKPITADIILQATAELFGFSVENIIGPRRQRPLVKARQVSMYVFRELTDLSYPDIARVFGNRDHTTAIHAVQKITKQMAEQPDIFNQVNELIQRIKNA
jgi:chromosomal replication initiator protein